MSVIHGLYLHINANPSLQENVPARLGDAQGSCSGTHGGILHALLLQVQTQDLHETCHTYGLGI